ncbi:interleukin-17C [Aquarana catesbeiana]|uniref:interleukin-17C n=1 Tax=Aquarana catesbeiana TaxID=8400 RepID=UPI003CC95992
MQSLWFLLLLAVFSASHCHSGGIHKKSHDHCFSSKELANPSDVLQHFVGHRKSWKRYSSVNLVGQLENLEMSERSKRRKRNPQVSCPNFEVIANSNITDISKRSISPWTYRIDVDENRFPQKLAFAKCLCNHCISTYTGKETSALNSVLITQSMLVLRKQTCPEDKSKYTFRIEYLNVPVACTCVVPR